MSISRYRRGFSLIELVIVVVIIGIIAAIAIPRMSRGSAGASDQALADDLASMRKALDLYAAEHNGVVPSTGNFTIQMTSYSDVIGTAHSTTSMPAYGTIYGPYLRAVPPLPVGPQAGRSEVAGTAGATVGWIYDGAGNISPNTGTLTDASGTLYSSY